MKKIIQEFEKKIEYFNTEIEKVEFRMRAIDDSGGYLSKKFCELGRTRDRYKHEKNGAQMRIDMINNINKI